jgi:hypothetical protein
VAATFLGLAAYSSARTSLKELVPWLPPALCLFVLLTVYFFPKLRQTSSGNNGTPNAMEEGRSFGFYGTPVEPGSVQSDEDNRSHQWNPEVNRWLGHDTSYAGGIGRPASRQSGLLSNRGSDIDLDDSQSVPRLSSQIVVSPSRQAYEIRLPTQRFAAAMGPASQMNQSREYHQGPLSPESTVIESAPSTSAELERLLLG